MALTEGSVDKNAIIVGDWSEISIEFPAGSNNWLFIGNSPEGLVEVSKEIYDHVSTAFPRKVDLRIPVRADMKFTCQIEEVHAENLRLILGQAPNDSNAYIYVGALVTPQFFKFRAKRRRNSDLAEITVVFWKGVSSGLLQLAGGDEAISSPLEVVALDDSAGDYGGSSDAPLGYINIPPKTV
jgi:hypothetical protein